MIDKGIKYKERTGFFSAGLAARDSISPGTSTSGGGRNVGGREDSQSQYGGGSYNPETNVSTREQVYGGPDERDLAMGAGGKQATGTVTDIEELSKAIKTDFSGGAAESPALKAIQQKNIDLANALKDRPFQGVNVPPYIPGSTVINMLGNLFGGFGYETNKKFFQENVAGKKGYGYGYEDYKQYMQDRGFGKVDAYGNPIDQGGGGGNGQQNTVVSGILENLLNDVTTDTTTSPTGFNYVPYSNQVVVAPGIEGLRSLMGSDAFKSIIK